MHPAGLSLTDLHQRRLWHALHLQGNFESYAMKPSTLITADESQYPSLHCLQSIDQDLASTYSLTLLEFDSSLPSLNTLGCPQHLYSSLLLICPIWCFCS